MRTRLAPILCAACAIGAAACDGFVGFIAASPSGLLIVNVDPVVVSAPPEAANGCPASAAATFYVVIQGPAEDVSLSAMTIRFVNPSGRAGEPVTYRASDLNRMFGSTVVAAGTSRRLSVSAPYGCSPPGATQMSLRVDAATSSGRAVESEAFASIREP